MGFLVQSPEESRFLRVFTEELTPLDSSVVVRPVLFVHTGVPTDLVSCVPWSCCYRFSPTPWKIWNIEPEHHCGLFLEDITPYHACLFPQGQ